jgi:uncharacterized phage protein (TIGR02220 family)
MKRIDECHAFNIHIACLVGIEKAIILKDLYGWCMLNQHNARHIHGGKAWTYNSAKAFSEKYPYMKPRTIAGYLDDLERGGWIESGNYNSNGFDRTKWYAIDFQKYDNAIITAIGEKLTMDVRKTDNGLSENSQPYQFIPSHTKEEDSRVAPDPVPVDDVKEVIQYLNKVCSTNYKLTTKATKSHIHARLKEGFSVADMKQVIDSKFREWGRDEKMSKYMRPQTLFSSNFESYLQAEKFSNADDRLNDIELTPEENQGYSEYIAYVIETYNPLYRSACKVMSKADWKDYKTNATLPGLPFQMTPNEKKRLMTRVHDRLNSDNYFRQKFSSVFDCFIQSARAIINQQKPIV